MSTDDRGFEVMETAGTVGNIVEGDSWLSQDPRLDASGGRGTVGWWFCIDAMSARASMFELDEDLLAWVWMPFDVAELLPVVSGLANGDETAGSSG